VLNHVFETMGTVVSITFRGKPAAAEALAAAEAAFAEWDARYSLYRADSELSRIASGELRLTDASEQLRATYAIASEWRSATDGAFTAHRPDGVLDLSGVVKALALASAAEQLELAGVRDWSINAGGDVVVSPGEETWNIGIVDPTDRETLLTSIALTNPRRACATSGTAERGDHIWKWDASADFSQVTVVADDIVTADVLATAIVAGGAQTLDRASEHWAIDVIAVDRTGGIRMTPGAVRAMHEATGSTDAAGAANRTD
jgi:FAD:protein FMN transferase